MKELYAISNRCYSALRNALPTLLGLAFLAFSQQASAQLINPAAEGGFENGTTFAANGWSIDNGAALNTWVLGTVPPGFSNRSAFVTNDGGTSWAYTNSNTSVVHFWRDVTFPAGQSIINLSFNWQALGETSSFDALMVSVAPTTYTPTATTSSLGTGALAAPAVTLGQFWNVGSVQTANLSIPSSLIGNCSGPATWRLIFTWKNDGSLGTSPPIAIDNISLTASAPVLTPMAGTYTVGTGGNYLTLTAAVNDVNARGVSAPVILELNNLYTSASETFPITLGPNAACAAPSSVNTVTIRPAAGAPLLSITGANAGPTIDFNNGNWWRIDGRPGGAGTTKGLVVSNTSTTGQAIRLINDASNNIIRYCDVQGVNTSTTSGVILFSTTTGTTGNDNNLIEFCDVHDGATTPTNCIYSSGTSTTLAQFNSNNTVSNCNIYNWFLSTSTSLGIQLTTANSDWTITGNSFYQTVARTLSTLQFSAINIPNTTGNYFTITNNFIGGSAPSCGGTAMTLTGAGNFRAVNMTVGAGTSLVQGNTIQNINLTTSNATNFNGALLLGQGNFLVNNNTIGSLTANNSIVVTSNAGTTFVFNGIILGGSTPTNTSTISNNSIGGISLTVTGAPATPGTIRGISIQGTAVNHNYIVTGNTIGSTTLANSITMDGNSAGFGIVSFSTALGQVITNNTISNITSTNSGTGNILWGILAQGGTGTGSLTGTFTLTGNTVQNLSSGTGNSANFALNGIQTNGNNATIGTNIVQQNTVRNLAATNPAVSTNVGGIVIVHPLVTNNLVARNLVHSLTMATTTNAGTTAGIFLAGGSSNVENNMVRLGVDGTGADITSGYGMIGIFEGAGNNNVRFNSVYIGGSGVSAGATNTFAFNSTVTTGARNYTSNIFFNARSNGAGTGKHYAMAFGGTAANPAGVASNYNNLFVTGTGGFIGLYNATDQATIGAWRTATGNDFQSVSGNPQYINPTGNSASVDLHIQAATPTVVEAAGQPVAAVTTDYDGQTRASLTPTDIGADAGNFLLSDVAPPGIGYTPLIGACGTNDFVLNGVNITDGTGIPLAGVLIPRIYFRKNAGSWFSRPGVLAGGGATNSTWNFTIVVADMGGVANGDIVDYYVIAQDNLGNVGSNAGGVVATDVNTVTTHPVTPNSMTVTASLSGTYTVGVGGNYATLTAAVADYNTRCIAGPVLFSLTDATYPGETFPITINSNIYASSTNTLTIKPAAGNSATISGTSATGLIVLNGADWVIINGSNGSTPNSICPPSAATRNLTLTNTSTSTTSAVIWLQNVVSTANGASNNQVINCNISGNGPAQTLCGIGSASPALGTASLGTNNNNNSFINNNISNAQYGIISQGNSAFNKNTGNVINQNLMNTPAPTNLGTGGVFVTFEDGIVISGNNISGMSQPSSPDVVGINAGFLHSGFGVTTFAGNECTNVTITNNIIGSVVNSGSFSAVGIALAATSSGTSLIANNMISGVAANGTASDYGAGIALGGGIGSTINVFYNTVSMQGNITGVSNASVASAALAVTNNAAPSNLNIRNNILSNTQAANGTSTQRHTAIALAYSGTSGNYAGLISDNNDLYSAGPGPGSYHVAVVGGIAAGPVRTTLANWQTETGRDANSFSVQPNFVSTTDLHLVTTSNQCLDGGGAPVSVTTDIDCQSRNGSIPDIGADEFTNPNSTLTISESSGTPNDGVICSGSQVVLTAAGGGTYLWSPGGATTASITVTPTITTIYNVIVTNGTCTDVLSQVITVNPSPTLNATLTQPTTCVSADGAIDLTVTNGGTYTVNWSDLPGTNDPEDRSGLIVGTYNVTVTNTVTGCTASASYNLTGPGGCDVCPTIPNVSVTPNPTCVNATFTMNSTGLTNMGNTYGIIFKHFPAATATPYTGGTVLATVPNGSLGGGGTTASATASLAASGTYFVYAVLTPTPVDPTCRPSATTTLVVNALPTPGTTVAETSGTTNNDGTICVGASATITATGGTSYLWSPGGATTAAITVAPTVTTTYTVTVTNANGCTATTTRVITVNPLPTLFSVTGGGSYCAGGPGLPVGLSGSQSGVNYQLQINNVNNGAPVAGTGNAINFGTFTTVGTYTVVATTTATGCSTAMTGSVSIATFNCNISISDPCVCLNNATTLTNGQFGETIKVNAPAGQTWTVQSINGLFSTSSLPPAAAPTPILPGAPLTFIGNNMYQLQGIHVDAIGYTVTVVNQAGVALTIGNSCAYPNPAITSDLSQAFCLFSDPVDLTGTPGDANIVSAVFTVNGVQTTTF
ncbi:MAG: hypothetical protein JNL02_15005, partial [Saprospiraceae bacterium]|nr:hypothetical protein [Saprospiraceae bacterium]